MDTPAGLPPTGLPPTGLLIVRFMAGGFPFAVEATQVRGMLADVSNGETVHAAEDLIGLPAEGLTKTAAPRRKCLLVGDQSKIVTVSEPVALETLPAELLFPLPAPVTARLSLVGIKALATCGDKAVLIVDLRALLSDR
jgi:hypothetical protein